MKDLLLFGGLFLILIVVVALALLALYLLKSALGINVFEHFSFGIWDWFEALHH